MRARNAVTFNPRDDVLIQQDLDPLLILQQTEDLVDGLSHHLLLLPHSCGEIVSSRPGEQCV